MSKNEKRRLTRRGFLQAAGTALAAGALPSACRRGAGTALAARKRLTILQWSHFVPSYDKWFDEVFTKEWGAKNGTEVVVDHMSAAEVNARGAAEAAGGKGHDLFLFISPPASYERQVHDLAGVVAGIEKKHGPMLPLARKSTLNPKTGKVFALSESYVPDPGNYRIDLWSQVGFPNGPDTWEDLRAGGRKIKEKLGFPVGIGLSQEVDSNMALRALLWSFGGSEQDEAGSVVLDSPATVEALKYMRALYREAMTPEVMSWEPASNNRMMLSGRGSFVQNAISVTRTAEKENPDIARRIGLSRALAGPARRIASEHVMNCYVVWKFAQNPEAAQQFLVDLVDASASVFRESEFYNLPCFPSTVPDLAQQVKDARVEPIGKYGVLAGAVDWTTNVGFPGYASAAVDEVFNTFVLPTMFARVARDEVSAEDAAKAADKEVRRIFDRWRSV